MPIGWNALTITPSVEAVGELRTAWSWLLPECYQPILFSAIGDLFYQTPSGEIWWLNTGTAEMSKVAESQSEFQHLLGTAMADEWLLPPLIENLIKAGKALSPGRCYTFVTLPIFREGTYTVENLKPVDAREHFALTGHIHKEISNLPDGISTGDFSEALAALFGKDAVGLSASTIGRLKEVWQDEHAQWQERDLSAKRYVYVWADGIYLEARLEDEKQCILVLIGATPEGKKELVGFTDGARESAHDWRNLLLGLKRRGLQVSPELTIADGGLGFWKAAGEIWPKTCEQRCWVHKTANVLAKLPKSQQPKAKRALQEIWMAETKLTAEAAFDAFVQGYQLKYTKAAECLAKDRDALLVFYDFPAEHWKHLRTTNPIESTFATVRHRTIRSKGCLSNKTALAMVFKLVEAAQRAWRRLDGCNQLPKVILGVKFADGLEVTKPTTGRQSNTTAA